MLSGNWIPLLNYSTKYNISLSTLRRRIKTKSIEFKLDNGKYFILDDKPPAREMVIHTQGSEQNRNYDHNPIQTQNQQSHHGTSVTAQSHIKETESIHSNFVEASVLTSANRLVEEIKSAYSKILQEKEEQISLLKEEIVDLRMLVRILEDSSNKTPLAAQENEETDSSASSSEGDFIFSDFQNRNV